MYSPTPQERDLVRRMLVALVDPKAISKILGITLDEFKEHFPVEIQESAPNMMVEVAQSLYQNAIGGHFPAQKFLLECFGWQTKTDKETLADRARPMQIVIAQEDMDKAELSEEQKGELTQEAKDAIEEEKGK